jgi:6-pyruvoyltetrahydropterin/6-carboxytetrahydropterin synthase
MDFSVIKENLCMWLEDNWDHKFLAYTEDPLMKVIYSQVALGPYNTPNQARDGLMLEESIVFVPFNPTAENMAKYLVEVIGPQQLHATEVTLVKVVIEETRKCSCTFIKE